MRRYICVMTAAIALSSLATIPCGHADEAPAWRDGVLLPYSYRVRLPVALYRSARFRLYTMVGR